MPAQENKGCDPEAGAGASQSAAERTGVVAGLFRQHNRNLTHFIWARMGGSISDASEVAQESYVRLLQLENTGSIGFLRAYLYRIAANLATDRSIARQRRPEVSAESVREEVERVADPFEIERTVLAADQYQQLVDCLRELPPKCRLAFELHRLQELPVEEVARKMALSERMVRKYVTRALIYCRFRMDGESPDATLGIMGHE